MFQATPQRRLAVQAIEAPDRAVEELRDELAEREVAVVVPNALEQHGRRPGRTRRRRCSADDAADRADHEGIAAAQAARREAVAEAASGSRRAASAAPMPMPAWLGSGRRTRPANAQLQPRADREALQRRSAASPSTPAGDQQRRAARRRARSGQGAQRPAARRAARATTRRSADGRGAASPCGERRRALQRVARDRVPRQQREARQPSASQIAAAVMPRAAAAQRQRSLRQRS